MPRVFDLAHAAQFHTTEKIGPKRAKTPDGFLVCQDVPLARTGMQEYGAHEIVDAALATPPLGYYRVERTPDEVFRPESLASWHGKPVTNDHPPDLVTPRTFKTYSVGTMINPRRGGGDQSNLLLVDMVIHDADAIAAIEAGKREVSGGYDCDYFEVAPGELQQRNIVGNHGALVDEARCGDLCTIHDHRPPDDHRRHAMSDRVITTTVGKLLGSLTDAFKKRDDKAFEVALGGIAKATVMDDAEGETAGHVHHSEGSEVHIHLPGMGHNPGGAQEPPPKKEDPMDEAPPWFKKFHEGHDARWKAHDAWRDSVDAFMKGHSKDAAKDEGNKEIEGELEEEAPPGTALNDARGAKDSAYLADSFQETCAGAEILAPGIKLPTLDRAAAPGVTFKAICGLRRAALDHAMASAATRDMVSQVTGGRMIDTKKATCRDVRNAFRGTVALKKVANRATADMGHNLFAGKSAGSATAGPSPVKSLADLNKMNQEFYAAKK